MTENQLPETENQFPELLEVEYSFSQGGHNSLKLVDGRLFFFSEADSHLSEKNEYLTMVSIPVTEKWEHFWDDLDQCGIWDWEEELQIPIDPEEELTSGNHQDKVESCHCHDENCDCDSPKKNISTDEIPNGDDIPIEGDIWQVKIIKGPLSIFCKNWCLKEVDEKSVKEFFQALKKLSRVDVTIPFAELSKRLVSE